MLDRKKEPKNAEPESAELERLVETGEINRLCPKEFRDLVDSMEKRNGKSNYSTC